VIAFDGYCNVSSNVTSENHEINQIYNSKERPASSTKNTQTSQTKRERTTKDKNGYEEEAQYRSFYINNQDIKDTRSKKKSAN
jgi:hypothetical protein